ncbi:PPC domain-containing protein [Melittangium boletus]|uniref:PPC domain-containing protein n=1 Tax=Melittangium boletus TaxID=83453 RepID=UPI000BB2D9F0|nr:PPC domain-containing protein [Melittangium boletus]
MASFIKYPVVTTGSYTVLAGCYANGACGGTVSFRVTSGPTSPLYYVAANTNNAQQNTVNRSFTLDIGDMVEVGTCDLPGASATGDTSLRLFGGGTQVMSNNDACGGKASFIRHRATTRGTYELRAGCNSRGSCAGTVIFRITPAAIPALTYNASDTNSAQQNTVNRTFTLNAGDVLEAGTCSLPGATATGDTYLRLFGGGTQVAYNDENCGGSASFFQYTAPTTGTYELRAGCYSNTSCGGTVVFRVTPAKK